MTETAERELEFPDVLICLKKRTDVARVWTSGDWAMPLAIGIALRGGRALVICNSEFERSEQFDQLNRKLTGFGWCLKSLFGGPQWSGLCSSEMVCSSGGTVLLRCKHERVDGRMFDCIVRL